MVGSLSNGLRLANAGILLLGLCGAGLAGRSPWLILVAIPLLSILYATAKWGVWHLSWKTGGLRALAVHIVQTVPTQAAVASVLYLIGLGLNRLFVPPVPLATVTLTDGLGLTLLFVLCETMGLVALHLEGALPSSRKTAPQHRPNQPASDCPPTSPTSRTVSERAKPSSSQLSHQ